jgi:hypothetical protein
MSATIPLHHSSGLAFPPTMIAESAFDVDRRSGRFARRDAKHARGCGVRDGEAWS